MTMTQSYYGGEFDSFTRSNHRAPTAAHYDRPDPYAHGYYEPPYQDLRSEYPGRPGTRTLIQEQPTETAPTAHARRRIQVACSRCRRRKIKCTGDPGDGSGCSACRSAGADRSQCTFIRVQSYQLPMAGVDLMPTTSGVQSATPTTATYGTSTDAASTSYDTGAYQGHHRPSLPMLQTRSAYPEYDSYNTSPVDEYTYASSAIQRQQSFPTSYGAESFRPYTSGSVSGPVTSASMYYEPGSAFSFGNLQFPATPVSRLPSVTGDAFSPLNMTSLHSSLPNHTVQERRLPMPYTQSYQQPTYSTADVPQIRPLGSLSEARVPINGIHSRSSMPWSLDNTSMAPSSRGSSVSGLPAVQQHHGLPIPTSMGEASSFGYQFSASSGSPDVSPTSGPSLPEGYPSTAGSSSTASAMLPPSHIRYSTGSSYQVLPALSSNTDSPRPSSARGATTASLYSFSAGVDNSERSSNSDRHSLHSSGDESQLTATPQHNYVPPLRHPQPQHAASLDELRRRSSYDQRASTAHRMSVSNLNGRY